MAIAMSIAFQLCRVAHHGVNEATHRRSSVYDQATRSRQKHACTNLPGSGWAVFPGSTFVQELKMFRGAIFERTFIQSPIEIWSPSLENHIGLNQ